MLAQQVRADFFYPLRFDAGNAATKEARGFHQFGADNPFRRLFAE